MPERAIFSNLNIEIIKYVGQQETDMHHVTTALLWIELGSVHALHGLLRGLAIGVGVIAGFVVIALFWSAGAFGESLETLGAHRQRSGQEH